MKSSTSWIAAIVLTLGLTPAVQAQYGGSIQWRYGNPSQTWHSDRVSALAHDIDAAATYIHQQAERNNRRPDRYEARALAELHQLNEAAENFHEQVETNGRSYYRTRDDFAELLDAYNDTVDTLRSIEPRSYIYRGMNRIAADMNELSRYYGSSYSGLFDTGRWGRNGRYDRRDDRYGDRHDRDGRYDRHDRDGRYDRDDRDNRDDDGYRPPHH
jgi:hypothetical protein